MGNPPPVLIVPTNPPNEGDFIFVGFNIEWIPIVLYALQLVNNDYVWIDPPDDITEQVQELIFLIQNSLD